MAESTSHHPADRCDLITLLDWYRTAGVDCALGDQPVDWMSDAGRVPGAQFRWPDASTSTSPSNEGRGSTPPPPARPPETRPTAPAAAFQRPRPSAPPATLPPDAARAPPARFATAAPEAAETAARTLARSAKDIAALQAALAGFEGCALKTTAKSTCVYRGAVRAPLMIIGEAPGRDEDLEGRPFVGRAGQLLDQMLAAIDLDESHVHITNVVYWRPPGNRTPTPQETQICRPFLERQVELVAPKAILLLGGAAAKSMLDTQDGIMRLRGKWHEITIGSARLKTIATLHPAYLLRTPAAKRTAWRDLLSLKLFLANN